MGSHESLFVQLCTIPKSPWRYAMYKFANGTKKERANMMNGVLWIYHIRAFVLGASVMRKHIVFRTILSWIFFAKSIVGSYRK